MEKRRVVITGIGCLSPLGNSINETWSAAKEGKSGITNITKFDASAFASQIAGEVKGFNVEDHMDRKEAKRMDIFSHYSIATSKEAWENAKLSADDYQPEKFGCVFGVGMGGLNILEDNHATYLKTGPRRISPFLIPGMITNLSAGHIAIAHGLKGVNFVVSSACTSSSHAIGEAARMIANGSHDAMMTGGSESTVSPMGIGGFAAMKALSFRNDAPEKASRPFDVDRDGFILSEGAVVIVLEEREAALKRNAPIIAEVVGYGVSCDAYHITAPSGVGAEQSMKTALADAGLQETDVDYVNAHGTSTPVGDVQEIKAIKNVFKEHANNMLVSSTKSMTGHLLGAAGAIETAFCALMLQNQVVLPTVNLDNPDPECDLDLVPHTMREAKLEHVLTNSFGFGGTNASLVLKRAA